MIREAPFVTDTSPSEDGLEYDPVLITDRLKNVPDMDRPREKLLKKGVESLTDVELVALILGSGTKDKGVMDLAKSVADLFDKERIPDIEALTAIDGIGPAKACQLSASLEFSRRKLLKKKPVIKKARDVYPFVAHIAAKKQEHFLCLSLSGANEVISTRTITIGLLNSSQIHPREVFADTISDRAAAVILAHNHPSGQLEPSKEDILVTERLCSAGAILGISVLDHIILTASGMFSFREQNLLPKKKSSVDIR